ncbi:MAG: chromate efflux transporter [Methanomicrobiales archaeon]|nr:chromate efflux transporter [Methanomicrobiales archaeon]
MSAPEPVLHEPKPTIGKIFLSFFRLGLTAFGGPAMVAYIKKMAVTREHWIDEDSFSGGVSFCQMVPGATAMQTAAYVGLRIRGWAGALASFVGFGLPAFVIMIILSSLYVQTSTLPASIAIFRGLQVITVAIIASAALSFGRSSLKKWVHGVIAVIAAGLFFFGVSPILVILLAGLLGYLFVREELPVSQSGQTAIDRTVTRAFIGLAVLTGAIYIVLFLFWRNLFDLAFTMSSIDIFAFGGGFAALPLMVHQVVDVHAWLDSSTFLNGIALGQVTPGPIVITATFVGYLVYGLPGAFAATFGIFVPSFLVVIGLAPHFDRVRDSPVYHRIFRGILFSFVGLIVSVTIKFCMGFSCDVPTIILGVGTFAALVLGAEILWVVIAGLVISYFLF